MMAFCLLLGDENAARYLAKCLRIRWRIGCTANVVDKGLRRPSMAAGAV